MAGGKSFLDRRPAAGFRQSIRVGLPDPDPSLVAGSAGEATMDAFRNTLQNKKLRAEIREERLQLESEKIENPLT